MTGYRSILIIKMSAMGDVVHALPSLHALRNLYPGAVISWLVEPQFAPLLPGPPWVDEPVVFEKNRLKKLGLRDKISYLAAFRKKLHSRHFDLVLDLQGLMKSTLAALLSGCRNRLGYCEMREGSFLFTRAVKGPNARGHVVERYRDVVRSLGPVPPEVVFPLPDHAEPARKMAATLRGLGLTRPLALLFPGAGWESKLWPARRFAELARELDRKGLDAAVGGAAGDAGLAGEIRDAAPELNLPDLTGRTDIPALLGLVSLASVCVGADTGPLHLAAARGIPTVSLFGPSSGERAGTWGALGAYVQTKAPCAPCFKRRCPRTFVCMDDIAVGEVAAAVGRVLAPRPPAAPPGPGGGRGGLPGTGPGGGKPPGPPGLSSPPTNPPNLTCRQTSSAPPPGRFFRPEP
ncbi:MAG: glycosyltransferase family 9 protein [Deltaproteobacteria bacterium]|nr:glycosyltransferase family 9 protein [Deltaproteobacteria bacterium]